MNSNRILLWTGIGLVAVIVAAAVLSTREDASFEPGTPEATVETFINAYLDRDEDLAQDQLADSCARIDFRWAEESARVALIETSVDGDRAIVRVRVSSGETGLFEASSWSRDEEYRLVENEAGWVIYNTTWPWVEC